MSNLAGQLAGTMPVGDHWSEDSSPRSALTVISPKASVWLQFENGSPQLSRKAISSTGLRVSFV